MTAVEPRHWIAVASAEHVALGRAQGFMQVCHGRAAPLRRLHAGDWVSYYSPSTRFGGKDRLQAFTALGRVLPGAPYAHDMGGGFVPFRRDVAWLPAGEAAIQPLLDQLDFTAGRRMWGYQFRFGLFAISAHDMTLIGQAMGIDAPRTEVASDAGFVQTDGFQSNPRMGASDGHHPQAVLEEPRRRVRQ